MFEKREVPTRLDKNYLKKYRNIKTYVFSENTEVLDNKNNVKSQNVDSKSSSGNKSNIKCSGSDESKENANNLFSNDNKLKIEENKFNENSLGIDFKEKSFNIEFPSSSKINDLADIALKEFEEKIESSTEFVIKDTENKNSEQKSSRLINFENFNFPISKPNNNNKNAPRSKSVITKDRSFTVSQPKKSFEKNINDLKNIKVPLILKFYSILNKKPLIFGNEKDFSDISPKKINRSNFEGQSSKTNINALNNNKSCDFLSKIECINKVLQKNSGSSLKKSTSYHTNFSKSPPSKRFLSDKNDYNAITFPNNFSKKFDLKLNSKDKEKNISPDKKKKFNIDNSFNTKNNYLDNENKNYRTQLCKYIFNNSCSRGDECTYSHDLSKFPCKAFFIRNNCNRFKCSFSHDKNIDKFLIEKLREDDNEEKSEESVRFISPLLDLDDSNNMKK